METILLRVHLTSLTSNNDNIDIPRTLPASAHRLTIKLPPMAANGVVTGLRRSTRRTTSLGTENSFPSGSEYHGSEKSMEVDPDADAEGEEEVPSPEPKWSTPPRVAAVASRRSPIGRVKVRPMQFSWTIFSTSLQVQGQ
jgi:hypothetical protein